MSTSKKLINQLQSFNSYKDMNEREIRKSIGALYGIPRARNVELEIELDQLNKPSISIGLNNDTLREILLRTDVDTLKQYCLTNKAAVQLCHDQYFWNEKLILEGLPPILLNNDLKIKERPMPNVENYYMFNTNNPWIVLYILMKTANQNAKKILLINDIESTRQYKPTTGVIQTDQSDNIIIKGFYVLPLKAIKKLKKLGVTTILTIEIHYNIKKKNYKLYLYVTDDYSNKHTFHQSISYHEALNIITLVLYDKYIDYNPDLIWQDSNEKEFYYDDDFRGGVDENGLLKQMIYETLVILEKKEMLHL